MELSALKQQICKKSLNNLYIFTGEERGIMRLYIDEIVKVKSASIQTVDSITNVLQKLRIKTMLQASFVYLVYDDKQFMSDDTLRERLLSPGAIGDAIVIFIYTTIDKRSKVYKNCQDLIVTFDPLRSNILANYIKREIPINDITCAALIDVCEKSYSRAMLEIDKMKQYAQATSMSNYDEVFNILINSGAIFTPPYDAIFDFVDAVLKNKRILAYKLLNQCYAIGEATLVIITNLYTAAKQTLQVQAYTGDDIVEGTGLTPFQVKLAKGRQRIYSDGKLVEFMKLLQFVESGIKTGAVEDDVAVEFALAQFWSR